LGIWLCVGLKLVSHAHVLFNVRKILTLIRKIRRQKADLTREDILPFLEDNMTSNQNLDIILQNTETPLKLIRSKDLWYFIMAPTLCYQLAYPRNKSIRKLWLLKQISQFIGICAFL
jgi:adenosine deaminase